MPGKVFLIPNTLGDSDPSDVLPQKVFDILRELDHFIVENIRNARRFIIKCGYTKSIDNIRFFELNKHTRPGDIAGYLDVCIKEINIGVISEAGVPGVADPGADIVSIAHEKSLEVIPLVGPSSILMSIMASGLNGQNFVFHGYLPIKGHDRSRRLKEIGNSVIKSNQTQIFIETPYRNNQLIEDIIKSCPNDLKLCIAADISLSTEFIKTKSIADWKKKKPDLHKRPSIYLIGI
jgi:16S rRNA (cytidine1402-2'-O)-methyltransferase